MSDIIHRSDVEKILQTRLEKEMKCYDTSFSQVLQELILNTMIKRKAKIGDIATCSCGYQFDLFYHYSRDMKKIKEHISDGHSVAIEYTSSILYS